jgi:endopolyphosphatase
MRTTAILIAARLLEISYAKPVGSSQEQQVLQAPLLEELTSSYSPPTQPASRRLHGRFIHITGTMSWAFLIFGAMLIGSPDLHPDPHYRLHSSTHEEAACHRGKGPAGLYGAETTDCDSPYGLIDATFKWIEDNVKDSVDFVIWTGDSARHDSDEAIPRTQDEVLATNNWVAKKFADTFSKKGDSGKTLSIPIISTFGNNDILPHNILLAGPNKWLKSYTNIWSKFIPEEQRHGFERGGWYFVEVIPNKLAVFSLNTLYFFKNNAGVDGCALPSEPGFEHFEWLRIQLQFLRQRGMKAILTGHVPPARTDSKELWDETCWQKYTLWLQQYRDIIVGGFYGHMNIDHFMLQDTREITILGVGEVLTAKDDRKLMEDDLSIESANDYLEELRQNWETLPNPASVSKDTTPVKAEGKSKKRKGKKGKDGKWKKSKKDKLLEKIGGPWGERFHVTSVAPSIVPNYFPTIRIVEYNITGLDEVPLWSDVQRFPKRAAEMDWLDDETQPSAVDSVDYVNEEDVDEYGGDVAMDGSEDVERIFKNKKKHKPKSPKKPEDPNLTVPSPPTKGTPPGPAYSPQSLTLLGYTQYFANLTVINNLDLVDSDDAQTSKDKFEEEKWRQGKHKGKHPKDNKPHPKRFEYQIEYDTFNDNIYKLKDMTVMSYIKLAHRIGQYKPGKNSIKDIEEFEDVFENGSDREDMDFRVEEVEDIDEDDVYDQDHGLRAEKHKKKHRREKNKVWLKFVQRAFVGTLGKEDLRNFEALGYVEDEDTILPDAHDGEL